MTINRAQNIMKIPLIKLFGLLTLISTTFCVLLLAKSESVHLHTLIHLPSALFVCGATLGVLLVWQPAERWRVFFAFINRQSPRTAQNLPRRETVLGSRFLVSASRAALLAGLGGELLGAVMILTSGAGVAAIEPGISLATVSLLYGLLLSELVFRPLRKSVTSVAADYSPDVETVRGMNFSGTSYSRPSMSTSSSGDKSVGSPA